MSSLPVTVEGAKLFATLPSGPDFQRFQTWLQTEYRRNQLAALPPGLDVEERKAWLEAINAEAGKISPLTHFEQLCTNDGLPMLLHSLVRREQPKLDLNWAAGLVTRANEGKQSAKEGVRELLGAMKSLMEAKKNASPPPTPPAKEPEAVEPSSTAPSGEPSPSGTG